jgi:hypothetical protein
MAARVSAIEVRVILPATTTLTDPQIDAAITAATLIVDELSLSYCGDGLSADILKQIELYLSAHFCAVTENTLTLSSETDACTGSSAKYGFKFGDGVKGTPFGQMANTLSSGCLAEFDKTPANFFSIGTHGDS